MPERLTETRSKADYRVLRDLLDIPQAWIAKRLGVSVQTVKNWESPKNFYPPRREAWGLLESLWAEADHKAAAQVDIASQAASIARDNGIEPAPIILTYWPSIKEFEREALGEESSWRVANAATRIAADRLRVLGLPMTFMYVQLEE